MDFKKIEKKWQDIWDKDHRYHAIDCSDKPKYYVLVEFPFPSGAGLHVGHTPNQIAMDIVARKKRAQGYNVLFPIGWDSFGLPTENYAIKNHVTPQEVSAKNIAHFIQQIKSLGISFDWDREIATSNEDYYRWTQWIFLRFYKAGLAYKATANINWCPSCKIGLSNEESSGGVCERCGTPTVQKPKSQWMLKMSAYSQKLLDGLDETQYWDSIKAMQRKWIGKSEGTNMTVELSTGDKFSIYTTCIETVMGVTYFVFAPEMPLVEKLKDKITNYSEVAEYVATAARKSEFERTELAKEKTGCELKGIYAIHPITGAHVPVFISDYVIASYGSGAVMAVPAHDERDYEFAKKFNLPMVEVIQGGDISSHAFEKADYLGQGCKLINSGAFDGLTVEEAKDSITQYLVARGIGEHTINYKMRDWVFSRQRYWGEPVPLVYCDKCGWVPVPDNELPVKLPAVDHYEPTDDGESPLSRIDWWVNTTCPHCGGKAKRETDVMPNWAGSSWYWLRYIDPHNDQEFASMDKLKYWGMVDLYNGGGEHVTRHLLYARFWHKFLYDQGLVPTSEPFLRRVQQGLILGPDGSKMSKSKGNVVDPMKYVAEYGADVSRLAQMFMGDYTETKPWTEDTIKPCQKLLNRIEALANKLGNNNDKDSKYMLATVIKDVTQDIDNLKFNTAISAIMIYVNYLESIEHVSNDEYKALLRILNPYAPHFTSEQWQVCGYGEDIEKFPWPTYNPSDLVKSEIEYAVQVNSKIVDKAYFDTNADDAALQARAITLPKVVNAIAGKTIAKIIVIKGRLINIIAK